MSQLPPGEASSAMPKRVDVDTPSRRYPILIGSGLLSDPRTWADARHRSGVYLVSDATVFESHGESIIAGYREAGIRLTIVTLPCGEAHKAWPSVERIVDALVRGHADRNALLVAFGGGVIGDLTGFAAACYMRGIDCVQVPTTLLSQVDSSVGGKTAINHRLGKNLIGAFHQPASVVIDLDTLTTLDDRQMRAGLAEVIKTALVADASFFEWLEVHLDDLLIRDPDALAFAVERCCRLKAAVVGRDERETAGRAILNFGHTLGHAIEAATGYEAWLHGEAVGAGMRFATRLSRRHGGLTEDDSARIETVLQRAGLHRALPTLSHDEWLGFMRHDKKADGGKLRFVLLEQIGTALLHPLADSDLVATLSECNP